MKKIIVVLLSILGNFSVFSQTATITFKPGAEVGQDANIYYTATNANNNFGGQIDLHIIAWTMRGTKMTSRSLESK